jgi:uncharacterized membrane protein YphA (DoxX/SURF4 family)
MRIVLAALLALHGIAHLVGFVGSWQLDSSGGIPYKTTVLAGHVNVGDAGVRALGVLWLVTAIAFVVTAAGTALGMQWWAKAVAVVATLSLALTIVQWPEARVGLFVNVGILIALGFV